MKIARLRNKGELELKNEIIEYPVELEGNRNLFTGLYTGHANHPNYNINNWTGAVVKIKPNTTYTVKRNSPSNRFQIMTGRMDNGIYAIMTQVTRTVGNYNENHIDVELTVTSGENDEYLVAYLSNQGHFKDILLKVEEGSKATQYTPSPEDLGLDYPDFIKSFSPKIYSHGVILTPEIIEFPIELVGKRNLFSGEFYRDINNYDDVSTYRYHLTNLQSNKRYAVRAWVKDGETATSNFWITLTSGHPNPNNAGANGGTYTHIINNGNPMDSQVLPRNNVPVYISYYPPNTDPSILDKYNISIQQLDSGYIQEWNPAPYDLGVNYTEDIDSFGIRPFGNMTMVSELREIPSELFGANRNLIKNSNNGFKSPWGSWFATGVVESQQVVNEINASVFSMVGRVTDGRNALHQRINNLKVGNTYTLSMWVRLSEICAHSTGSIDIYINRYVKQQITKEWSLIHTTQVANSTSETIHITMVNDYPVDIALPKLELGENVTRWTPAPEDLGFNYPDEIQSF